MTDEERIRRGEEARRILSEPLLLEAFATLERMALDGLVSAPVEDDVLRRYLAERIRLIRALRSELETAIAIGTQAAREAPGIY